MRYTGLKKICANCTVSVIGELYCTHNALSKHVEMSESLSCGTETDGQL